MQRAFFILETQAARRRLARKITTISTAAIVSNPVAPISSAKPLCGSVLGVAVGVLVGAAAVPGPKVAVLVPAAALAAAVCASAAWVSRAFTVAVAGAAVKIGVIGVPVRLGVAVGGGSVFVLVDEGVRLGTGLLLGVSVASATAVSISVGAAERCEGRITSA